MKSIENSAELGGRVRVNHLMPELSEGLGRTARSHLVKYHGYIGVNSGPLVLEMIDIHGKPAEDLEMRLTQLLKAEESSSRGVASLEVGDNYAVNNPNQKDPVGRDAYLLREHRHPDWV